MFSAPHRIIYFALSAVLGVGILTIIVFTDHQLNLSSKLQQQSDKQPVSGVYYNLFTLGSEKLKTCLRKAIGTGAYSEIAQEKRAPKDKETEKILPCFEKYGRRNSSPSQFVSYNDLIDPNQLVRNYPGFIKCAMVSEARLLQFSFELKKVKEFGLNTICIYLAVPEFSPSMRYSKRENEKRILELEWMIGKINREGLAVAFVQDLCCYDAEQEVIKGASDEMLSQIEKNVLMWAKVAQEYKVEYLTPLGEIEGRIDWFAEKEGLSKQDEIIKANRWLSLILPKLRKVFDGKLIAHYGNLSPELDPSGYDYFGFTHDHYSLLNLDKFRQMTRHLYRMAIDMEERYQVKWLIPEAFFPWEEPHAGPTIQAMYRKYGQQLRELQDDYFRISFEEIGKLPIDKKPKGFNPGYAFGSEPSLSEASRREIKKFLKEIN